MREVGRIITTSATILGGLIWTIVTTDARPQIFGMTSAQQIALKALGSKVVVPGYVPTGFRVVKVTTECPLKERTANPNKCRFGPNYAIIYRSPQNACFAIEGASGGLGDVDGEYKVPVNSKLLGSTTLWIDSFSPRKGSFSGYKTLSSAQLNQPQSRLITQWFYPFPSSGMNYHLISYSSRPSEGSNLSSGCRHGITPHQAILIFESLEWLI